MGGHPYWYVVPYREDVQGALDALREREFAAGRYNPVLPFIEFEEPAFSAQQPGAQHASIEDAIEEAMEDGTRSILDIEHVATRPDYGCAAPLPAAKLTQLFGTDRPTREMVLASSGLFADIERGQCIYVVLYDGATPRELYFAGYSYD